MFNFGAKKFLGIDIGVSAIRIVALKRGVRGYELDNYGEVKAGFIRHDSELRKEGFSLFDDNVPEIISAVCREMKTNIKDVNFSIPDFSTFSINLEIPKIEKSSSEKVFEMIKYEVRPFVPVPLSDLTLDWVVVEEKNQKSKTEVLVVAIPNEIIRQYQEISRRANLKLRVLEAEVFALTRSAFHSGLKGVIGLIDIGENSTTINIVEKGVLKTNFTFNIAGRRLTETLANSLNIDYNKAEEIKIKIGLKKAGNGIDPVVAEHARKSLMIIVNYILEETKKVFRNFYQQKGKKIEKVVLHGGSSLLPGLKEYFEDALKKPTEILNPFVNISYKSFLKEALKQRGPFFAVAVGLALKGLEE